MVDIRPNALPAAITPLRETDSIIVDQGSDGVRKASPFEPVNSVAPVTTQSEAVAGVDNVKRMTSLRTKQSIASEIGVSIASNSQGIKADSAVQSVNGKTGNSVTLVKGDIDLGNVDNTSDASKPVSTATQTALDLKANSSVSISAGTGLSGGGNLTANRTLALNAASIASLAKADSSVQTVNGISPTSGNVQITPEDIRLEDTIFTASSATIPAGTNFVRTSGFSTIGKGGALYKRVSSEPSHIGKFKSANNIWFEITGENLNPYQFGASGSEANSFATGTSGSSSITLSSASDFLNGQYIAIEHGGASTSILAPTGITVAADGLNRQGPTGSTTYSYICSGVSEDGAVSAASAPVTITNGNDTLGKVSSSIRGLAFNVVRWTSTTPGVAVWRSKSGGAYQLIGVFGLGQSDSIADGLMDSGLPEISIPWIPATPPSSSLPSRFIGKIVSGGGTNSITVEGSLSSSVSGAYARHDDTLPLYGLMANTKDVFIPSGVFNVGFINVPSNVISIKGLGHSSTIQGWGVLNATVLISGLSYDFVIDSVRVKPIAYTNQVGIHVNDTDGCIVKDCFTSGNLSIFVSSSDGCKILNNTVEDWIDDAILVYQSGRTIIEGNVILQGCAAIPQNAAAIQTYQSSENIIKNNKSYGFHVYSIKCEAGNQNIIEGNYSFNSWVESYHLAGSCSANRIINNTMFGGTHCMDYAISISNDDRDDATMFGNEVSGNYIYQCGTAAIAVVEFGGANANISNTVIKGNTIIAPNQNQQPNMPGIHINGSKVTKTFVDGNTFFGTGSIDFLVKEDGAIYGMPSGTQVGTLYGEVGYSATDGGKTSLGGVGSVKLTGGTTGL